MTLTLYYHPLSSYCHKVLIALYENGIAFDKRLINLGDAKERDELESLWPVGKFPVLRDLARARTVAESSIIIEYVGHFFPGARPLLPSDWEEAHSVRLWDRVADLYLQAPLQEIVGDRLRGAKGDMSKPRATLHTAYRMIDRRLESRTWLAGQDFSMADCAAAPALFFACAIEPFPHELARLGTYFERLTDRPSVARVIGEARPYLAYFPFAATLPARFRHPVPGNQSS